MSEVAKSSFQFTNFLVKESHFVLNNAGDYDFELVITPSGVVVPAKGEFQLKLTFEATDKNDLATISVVALAFFTYSDIDDVVNTPFLIDNAPAIAFPYIRAYISSLTTLSGIAPIILPTLNLSRMNELLRQNIEVL